MASSSGTSSGSGSYTLQNSGSEEDLQQLMDQRKRKRMISNRESARRSRMRKQKHLDDLMSQLAHQRKENNQILTTMNVTTQYYLNVEAENLILRAQVAELSNRFESLTQIISFLNANNSGNSQIEYMADGYIMNDSWNYVYSNQPIMNADILQY
ncbi:bZIP transcription factor 44-like [Nicotiana tabacum]|uniref:BZIP transcription factor 44-like n=2 Tax=Nicotiana TaxID=4085 RepID=A0A1S4A5L7_TOBAC|nr:PREDICTED: ocs element-binding factor 1-like [Nicotiana sylvestris]XP_016471889.1 PREDICTED: bZIP transcription factor 53-like [Nicotiana tabacum]